MRFHSFVFFFNHFFPAIKWERFFVDVEIPEKIAAEYAKKFAEQRVQFEMRGELTRNLLVELGIKALGDQVKKLFQFFFFYHA